VVVPVIAMIHAFVMDELMLDPEACAVMSVFDEMTSPVGSEVEAVVHGPSSSSRITDEPPACA
jgi:hypothetical protein